MERGKTAVVAFKLKCGTLALRPHVHQAPMYLSACVEAICGFISLMGLHLTDPSNNPTLPPAAPIFSEGNPPVRTKNPLLFASVIGPFFPWGAIVQPSCVAQ